MTILIAFFGLQKKAVNQTHHHEKFTSIIIGGLKASKNPNIFLSYLSSFAARGDSIIVSTFLITFIQNYGKANGVDPKAALTRAGEISGFVQVAALCFAPVIGFIADKVNRTLLMIIVAAISCVGYALFGLIEDPYNWSGELIVAVVSVGIGEMGILVMCQSLLAQHAPKNETGAVSGFFAFSGSVGILIATTVGGYLFDSWREGAPFIIFSIFNGIVFIAATIIFIYQIVTKTNEPLIYKKHEEPKYKLLEQEDNTSHSLQNHAQSN